VLRDLGFADGTFVVEIEQVTPNSHGCDSVEFRLSTRAGVEPVSLASGVSGGEMSRVSLALTTVAAIADALPALVFDEVDAGIGGNTAHAVGRCLTGLASQTQVLAVTHLPQVAAVADQQWVVTATRTGAELRVVDGPTRVAELCRMLGLDPAEDVARQVAAAMLATP
jgi:DNA repair protein RecN (Recombination protein N)